jgi:DNA/RNA endonuclease YhcR with UshA esterase domain
MTRSIRGSGLFACVAIFVLAKGALAQQGTQGAASFADSYSVSREVSLQGTVVSFAENSSAPTIGAHAVLQTGSGQVDVHLGNMKLLEANHVTLSQGDSVRVIGENVRVGSGTQFVARLLQKGNQTIALRSSRGFPLRPTAAGSVSKAGAL